MAEEGLTRIPNDLIHIGKPVEFDEDEFLQKMKDLMLVSYENSDAIKYMVEEMVDTYHSDIKLTDEEVERYQMEIEEILKKNN